MFAFRHKFTGTFLYCTYVTDNWGNNALITLIEEKSVNDHQYEGTAVYVQPHVDALVKVINMYEKQQVTHDEYAGTFDEPVAYIPLEEYEIVELEIVLK